MIEFDDKGVLRLRKNRIVRDVYDHYYDLNDIERHYRSGHYTLAEKFEFIALIGYSVDGWNSLLYQDFNVEEQTKQKEED